MINFKGNLNDKWNEPLTFALYLYYLDYSVMTVIIVYDYNNISNRSLIED